jgi:superoxide reductase
MGLSKYIHAPENEGREKHVPAIILSQHDNGTLVTIKVGKDVLHPTTKEHHIEWASLYGEAKDGKFVNIVSFSFGDGTAFPIGSAVIKKEDYKSLTAVIYCNLHGLWDDTMML